MDMPSDTWRAQERQDNAAKVEILVDGSPEWRPHLNVMTRVGEHFAEWCGGADVSLLKAMRVEAWANDVAFERCVGNEFLNRGYTLEAM